MDNSPIDSFEMLRPQLIRWLKIFSAWLVASLVCIGTIYEPEPLVRVSPAVRVVLTVFCGIAWAGVLIIGGLLVAEWLFVRDSESRK